jgi:hypothetical protein
VSLDHSLILLLQISTDAVKLALDKLLVGNLQGMSMSIITNLQTELDTMKTMELTAIEVQRKLQVHTESADQLDVAMKVLKTTKLNF